MSEKYNDLLQQYIDGTINPLEKILLDGHLASCRNCRRELSQLKLLDWDLQHQVAVEIPAELAACRIKAVRAHVSAQGRGQKRSLTGDVWRLQLQILHHTSSFIGYNPLNRSLGRSVKSSVSVIGRLAGSSLKKRTALIGKHLPGQA